MSIETSLYGQRIPSEIDYGVGGDEMACYPASIAYLLFRVGADQELWKPPVIDRALGKEPGEPTRSTEAAIRLLLKNGAQITEVSPFHGERAIDEGLAYLVEFCETANSAGGIWYRENQGAFFDYWTPGRIEMLKRGAEERLKIKGQYTDTGQFTHEVRSPTYDDVVESVDPGGGVLLSILSTLQYSRGITHHLVVVDSVLHVADTQESGVTVFDNSKEPPFWQLTDTRLGEQLFLPDEGISIVRAAV